MFDGIVWGGAAGRSSYDGPEMLPFGREFSWLHRSSHPGEIARAELPGRQALRERKSCEKREKIRTGADIDYVERLGAEAPVRFDGKLDRTFIIFVRITIRVLDIGLRIEFAPVEAVISGPVPVRHRSSDSGATRHALGGVADFFWWDGFGEEEALQAGASEEPHHGGVCFGFHPFSDHLHAEAAAEPHHG